MTRVQFIEGRRYVKAVNVLGDSREAVAFLDKTTGLWLEAESWKRPRHRIAMTSAELARAYKVAGG